MQVSIRTLVNLTRNAELQGAAAHVLGAGIDDAARPLTQVDIDAIGAELDRRSAWVATATLNQLDPFSATLALLEQEDDPGRVTGLRYELQCAEAAAAALLKDFARNVGLEQPTQWQDI